ncbi:hypothetical protein N2152v2_002490 [Parachlorella kessleri]
MQGPDHQSRSAGFVLLKEPGRIRLRSLLNIRPPDYPEAVQWLEQFYQQQAQEGKGHLRRIHSPSGSPPQAPAEECGAPELPRRSNLVVGTVGDGWDPSWWLSRPDRATFDLIVLYYGRNASFTCAGCTHIVHSRGPKWYLYYNLTESPLWQQLLERGYEYIMLPDDDLRMDTCQINTFFSALKEFSVVLGQPSVCRGEHSYTCWEELFQDPQYRLRYTNFIEIMAPALRFDFFQHVVRYTLEGTYTGYGLDFAWPALLHWPRNKVAVVDDICMVHPPSPPGGKPGGLYDVTGRFTQESGYQEQQRTNRKYNYWQPVVWSHGFLWKTPKIFGGVNKQQRYEQQQQQSVSSKDLDDEDSFEQQEDEKKTLLAAKPSTRDSRAAAWVCTVGVVVYLLAYAWGLRGGTHSRDLQWMNAHLTQIGTCLALSVAAWTTALWSTVAFRSARQQRLVWPLRAALALATLLFLAWDHGNDFHRHGLYNWLLFVVISLPLNLVLLGLWAWYCAMTPKRFAASFVGAGVMMAVLVTVALVHYKHVWYHGFFNHTMAVGCPPGGCNETAVADCSFPEALPWVDLLPPGAQNFWTGSQQCKSRQHFKADFTDDGLLTIRGCKHPEEMAYVPFPSTRHWPVEWKTYHKASYQNHVLQHMKPVEYTGPVYVPAEALLARCGKEERLLVRVRPIRERKDPDPPLKTFTGSSNGSSSQQEQQWQGTSGGSGGLTGKVTGVATGSGARQTQRQPSGAGAKLNIVFLFVDSVSRRHFFRRMPRTAAALEGIAKRGTADLYQFFRYHTVGFSTDPNTHALYTGTTMEHPGAIPVWQAYRNAGYVTGSAYNLCEGWGADYNQRAGRHDHELVAPFCDPEYHPITPDGEPYKIFQGAFSILRRCLRGRFVHRYNFDYMRSFLRSYHGVSPYFLLSSFHEGHEGTGEVLATLDPDAAEFLEELTPDQLNTTLVIMLADHGLTMGLNFLFTQNGKTEHKNPFLAMLAPRWLPQAYPELAKALRGNEQRLLSAFDIHTMLHHVLHLGDADQASAAAAAAGGEALRQQYPGWAKYGNVSSAVQWGTSLLAPIAAGRSCDQALVPPDNCMCRL